MSTCFMPRNKAIKVEISNITGAQYLRKIIGRDEKGRLPKISGVGAMDYVDAKTAREYAEKINLFLSKNTDDMWDEDRAFLNRFADFFHNSGGFGQI